MTYCTEVNGNLEMLKKRVNTLPAGMEMYDTEGMYLCFEHKDRKTLENYIKQTFGEQGWHPDDEYWVDGIYFMKHIVDDEFRLIPVAWIDHDQSVERT